MRKASPATGSRRAPGRERMTRASRELQLLDVALRLFIEHGYQGTSIEDVASAAGVTRPIVYHHFGSKDGIYLACLRRARSELDQRMIGAAQASTHPQDRVLRGIDAYFAFVEDNRAAWAILFGGGVAVAGPAAAETARLRNATVQQIAMLLTATFPHVEQSLLEAFAHSISGAGEQLAKWWQANPELSRAELVQHLLRFAWGGLQQFSKT